MLRVTASVSAAGACRYFEEELQKGDYYTNDKSMVGRWQGRAASLLGLEGEVTQDQFHALTENRHPETGKRLTVRQAKHRRVGYDFTFSAKKSVSVMHAYTGDERIVQAFQESVRETMRDIESHMETRVRKDGQSHDRTTGNLLWSEFVHFGARPIDGSVDPHLHCHAYVFNTTYDLYEGRWKAGQFGNLKRDAPYYEAMFDARLAQKLEALGYVTERQGTSWELKGLERATLDTFSRRTLEIEDEAQTKGITSAKRKSELGARTRRQKKSERGQGYSQQAFLDRLSAEEKQRLEAMASGKIEAQKAPPTADEAIEHALAHSFERNSVMPERRVLAEAMKFGVGSLSPKDIQTAWDKRSDLLKRSIEGQVKVTTRPILDEEKAMLAFCREGKGQHRPLVPDLRLDPRKIDAEGRNALNTLLGSQDRVTGLKGGAGTGKTFLATEAVRQLRATGTPVMMLAPTASASRGTLRKEGFEDADTVTRFLTDATFQQKAKGGVVWIDEAGLLGARIMVRVFETAQALKARVVLVGDDRQHRSVERGDALRTLIDHGGLQTATLSTIRRQKVGWYKRIVSLIAEGQPARGFEKLVEAGAVQEILDPHERHQAIVEDYVQTMKQRKSVLVVAPTHREGDAVTQAIRERLHDEGILRGPAQRLTVHQNLNFTDAQKSDAASFAKGHIVQFDQHAPGFKRGEHWTVQARTETGAVVVENAKGQQETLPLTLPDRFSVYRPQALTLNTGDTLRITKGGTTKDGLRLNNGDVHQVAGFTPEGDIQLANRRKSILSKDFANFHYNYTATSIRAQGKTISKVIVAQSSTSIPASSRAQFYVSTSRARDHIHMYTDDIDQLRHAVLRSDERMAAVELVAKKPPSRSFQHVHLLQRFQTFARNLMATAKTLTATHPLLQKYAPIGPSKDRGKGIEELKI